MTSWISFTLARRVHASPWTPQIPKCVPSLASLSSTSGAAPAPLPSSLSRCPAPTPLTQFVTGCSSTTPSVLLLLTGSADVSWSHAARSRAGLLHLRPRHRSYPVPRMHPGITPPAAQLRDPATSTARSHGSPPPPPGRIGIIPSTSQRPSSWRSLS